MNIPEFIAQMENTQPPAPESELAAFEAKVGCRLPDDYRSFLVASNGGYVGGRLWFMGVTPNGASAEAGVHHVGGLRTESYFSLTQRLECYRDRIPCELLWIMDDPFGNAVCIGLTGNYRGRIYFWDHEREPDSEEWDGSADSAENLTPLTNTFTDFVTGLQPEDTVA